jgi:uncharacterized lipoprotein YddW (UPF0748 family)
MAGAGLRNEELGGTATVEPRDLRWIRWGMPIGLLVVSLLIGFATLKGPIAIGDAPPSLPSPPSVEEEQLWAAVGLNDAWFIRKGYVERPEINAQSVQPPSGVPELPIDTDRATTSPGSAGEERRATAEPTPTARQGALITLPDTVFVPRLDSNPTSTPTPTPTATPTPTPTPTSKPELSEVRAVWVTRYDWTSLFGSEGPADVDAIVKNVADSGFNTIFFQVRATGDAYYTPGLEPWSERLNDAQQLGQHPGWDPLARMVEQAHERDVRVQAYVNVYPVWLDDVAPAQGVTPEHPFWTWSHAYTWDDWRQWHITNGPMQLPDPGDPIYYLWASPGADGVRDHILAVVNDIVSRYDVDGIHLDLVRYANSPYSYDPFSNAAAGSVKTPERDQWQRDRVTGLVSSIHSSIRGIRPGTELSAAVWFCYYADGCGYNLSSGYAHFYQDSLGWLRDGVIDAIAPMLYEWSGFDNLTIWRNVMLQFQTANAGRHVYPGISGDFASFSDIASRIQAVRDAGAAGHAIFSYRGIDENNYWDDFANGPYAQPAVLSPLP